MSWINTQLELDQPDILRALGSLIIENFGIITNLDQEEVLATLDEKIQELEDSPYLTRNSTNLYLR